MNKFDMLPIYGGDFIVRGHVIGFQYSGNYWYAQMVDGEERRLPDILVSAEDLKVWWEAKR
jgi:hypothetical protein